MLRRLLGSLAVALVALVGIGYQTGRAALVHGKPLGVRAASVRQDGLQLVWRLRLYRPFSPSGLKRDGRTLCLLIERASNSSIAGQACILGPRPGHRRPLLAYAHITPEGPAPGRLIGATNTRSSSNELTARFLPSSVGVYGYKPFRWQVLSTLRPPGCAPRLPNRIGCFLAFPARPRLVRLHRPRLVGCVPSGPPFVYNGPRSRHVVALTFDDGPWYDTPQFLDVLESKHVVATFFQIGEQISTYGGPVENRMLADGDVIGDHTWDHADVSGDGSFAAGEINATAGAIYGATGFWPCLFRAPYGSVSPALIDEARSMGFTTIQWDVDPQDWSRPGTDAIYSNVVNDAQNGSIILQHDGGGDRSETLAALPGEIDTLRGEGYQFVTFPDLLGQRLIYK